MFFVSRSRRTRQIQTMMMAMEAWGNKQTGSAEKGFGEEVTVSTFFNRCLCKYLDTPALI